jgi:hypothetical protein
MLARDLSDKKGGDLSRISFLLSYEEGGDCTTLNNNTHSKPYTWDKGVSSTYLTGARHISAKSEYKGDSQSDPVVGEPLYPEVMEDFLICLDIEYLGDRLS